MSNVIWFALGQQPVIRYYGWKSDEGEYRAPPPLPTFAEWAKTLRTFINLGLTKMVIINGHASLGGYYGRA